MSAAVELIEKRCDDCAEVKPLSEFHKNKRSRDGHQPYCKPCNIARAQQYKASKRAELGNDAFLAWQRESTARSRAVRGMKQEKDYTRAKSAATQALISKHRKEFDHLFLLARRGELQRPEANGGG